MGANPACDAFPMQHQIFYPSSSSSSSSKTGNSGAMWYDPVFCVETLEGDLVWCKRHYRCVPRVHWSGRQGGEGAWTLTTLDNGMVSEEHWTTVDAADDLSWTILHYSGAADERDCPTSVLSCALPMEGGLRTRVPGLWNGNELNGPFEAAIWNCGNSLVDRTTNLTCGRRNLRNGPIRIHPPWIESVI